MFVGDGVAVVVVGGVFVVAIVAVSVAVFCCWLW